MVVADGMGGHAAGELASQIAISGVVKLALARPDWILKLDGTQATEVERRAKERVQDVHSELIAARSRIGRSAEWGRRSRSR